MADEDKTMMEVDDTSTSAPKKSSPIMTYGIYAGIVLVMIIAAYFVTTMVVKPMFSKGDASAEVDAEHGAAADHKESDGGHGDGHGKADSHAAKPEKKSSHGGGHGGSAGAAPGDIFLVSDIIVNPAGTGGTRFLSAAIGFELETGEGAAVLIEKEAIVRDQLITILSSQSVPELSDFKQRERLRKLIELRVEKILDTKDISAVYFTEFVLQ